MKKIVSSEQQMIYQFLKTHPQPYVPTVYEVIPNGQWLIILEEYLTGQNLEELLETKCFSDVEASEIVIQLCYALEPLHKANIVCRDLKPANVMMTTSGEVKLVDFNIARTFQKEQSRDTLLMGTEAFASPEQFGFGQTDARSDIYSLGIMLNYLILKEFPIDRLVAGPLHNVIQRCISLDPKDRYQSVDMLANDLIKLYAPNINKKSEIHGANLVPSKQKEKKSFVPPGFRSRKIWKMIVATLGYVLLTCFCFTLSFNDHGIPLPEILQMIYRFFIWLFQLLFIGIVCNYRNWRDHLPIVNHKNRFVRVVGYCLEEVILFVSSAVFCALIEVIFF